MTEIKTASQFRNLLNNHKDKLNVAKLGKKSIDKLFSLVFENPPDLWLGDEAIRREIPCIPNAEGNLIPLNDERGNSNFFSDSEKFPDLIPSKRRIHKDFVKFSDKLDLKEPVSEELSSLVDEAARAMPDVFSNLQKHSDIHKQVSLALLKIVEGTFPTENMRNELFIPCLFKGKITTRGLSKIGPDFVWPIDSIGNAAPTSFHTRKMIFADSPTDRQKLNLHKEILENLHWLELHNEVEVNRPKIRDELKANIANSEKPGVNIIRSLIFALPFPTVEAKDYSLFHIHDDGQFELEKWIGKKFSKKERDEILNSLLRLIRTASEKNDHKGMSTGWGADSRDRVHSLHLLKDETGNWSTLSDLCFDLRPELQKQFRKKAVSVEHRELLGLKVLTNPIGVSKGAGLGITHRIGEVEIKEKLGTIDAISPQVKSKILGMMLESEEEWELSSEIGLSEMTWVPNQSDKLLKLEDCVLPTKSTTQIIGLNHPWNLVTDVDTSSENVKSRSKELGIKSSIDDPILLHRLLLEPEQIWTDLKGKLILQQLTNFFLENPDIALSKIRRKRLPDGDGNWHW